MNVSASQPLHSVLIRICQLAEDGRHILQRAARQIVVMKLCKLWITVLLQRQHFTKIGGERFLCPMVKLGRLYVRIF